MNTNNYTLSNSNYFKDIKFDFYENDEQEYFFTREQIGTALGYTNPNKAIDTLHTRHRNRLDKYSTTLSLRVVEGNRTVNRETILYSEMGVYEICRWSQKPKANEFMDWVWQVVHTYRNCPDELPKVRTNSDLIDELHNLQLQNAQLSEIINKMNTTIINQNDKFARIESLIYTLIPPIPVNPWKTEIANKVKALGSQIGYSDDTLKSLYSDIYLKMAENYGLDINTYKANYLITHKDLKNVSTISVIANFDELKEAFEDIVDNYIVYSA